MKPSAMLYRNLLAIEVEEMVRANPLDGLVVLANCDKSVPGALMGAISANVPTVLVTGGARPRAMFRGRALGAGTDLWRMWDERRAGRLDDAGWRELEEALGQGCGACNTMGTASTMAVLAEALGLMVPGAASIPAGDPRGLEAAARAGRVAVEAVLAAERGQPERGSRGPADDGRRTSSPRPRCATPSGCCTPWAARPTRSSTWPPWPAGPGPRSRWRTSPGWARTCRCWPTWSRRARA